MSKSFQVLLATTYVCLTSYSFITLLKAWGLPISHRLTLVCCAAWTVYCFSSAYFRTRLVLARYHVRQPVREEEDKLNGCFQDVLEQAGIVKKFRLLIQEEMGCNAFAVGLQTIVVSRGLLDKMSTEELKAVLAHELGHLQSKDCLVSAAFSAANFLPWIITVFYEMSRRILLRGYRISADLYASIRRLLPRGRLLFFSRVFLLAFLIGLGYWLYGHHLLLPPLATALFVWVFRPITRLFLFLWKMTARFMEYKQDAYACQLGYGPALRQALLKLTLNEPQVVSLYEILMRGDHPVIYNRIRRLEKVEGLR